MLLSAPRQLLESIGRETLYRLRLSGDMTLFLLRGLKTLALPPYQIQPVLRQIYFIGARSLMVITVTALFTGMVLALLAYHNLSQYGSMELIGAAVGLGLVQELGPVLAALMIVGRAGSAMCAEIGIMRTSEQIDALECMGIDPYRFLMAPRFVAAVVSVPLLTFIFDVVGIAGGYLVAVIGKGVSAGAYMQGMIDNVDWHDLRLGMVKPLAFSFIIVWIATYKGFHVHENRHGLGGAEGVSQVTTDAVVLASVCVLAVDYLVGVLLL